jgi:hypothetical protein
MSCKRSCIALVCFLAGAAPLGLAHPAVAASNVARRFASDIDGVELIVTYEAKAAARDYSAQTDSGVAPNDPYATARGADKGLVRLMNDNGRQVKRYTIPRARIRALVRVTYDMDVLERADLVFTDRNVVVVHTSTSNGGIFTSSDVYELRYKDGDLVDRAPITRNKSLARMVDAGLSVYRSSGR